MGEYYEKHTNDRHHQCPAARNKEANASGNEDNGDNVHTSLPSLNLSSLFTWTTTRHVMSKLSALVLLLAVVVPLMDLCFTFGRSARFHYGNCTNKGKQNGQEALTTFENDSFISKSLFLLQSNDDDDEDDSGSNTPHAGELPSGVGQQVLIDLENIQSMSFLKDKDLIMQSMMEILQQIFQVPDDDDNDEEDETSACDELGTGGNIDDDVKLELKHFCHHTNNKHETGVYCVGQWSVVATNLEEAQTERGNGQYALTTSPLKHIMTIDLYVSRNGGGYITDSSVDIARLAQRVVAQRANNNDDDAIHMTYMHQFRGFYSPWDANPDSAPPLSHSKGLGMDLGNQATRWALKEVVTSVETSFQQIDIVDFINTNVQSYEGYLKSISQPRDYNDKSDDYERRHVELYQPNRAVYLDGVIQSTRHGDEAYHEALVQPGMFAHSNPKRAAIIGGGEGATLREILKHDTIEHVKMIEIDAIMIEASRKFLPTWNLCDDIEGSTPNCFDEPRADVRAEDALAWFIDRFGPNATIKGEEKFDVIIMDALDPHDNVAFASTLYSNDDFTESLYNALTPEGVLVMQLGEVPFEGDLPDEYSISHMRASLEHDLIRFGFKSLHKYEEAWCGFGDPWSYTVALKSLKTRRNWYHNEAQMNLKIQKRIRSSKTEGTSLLKYFDGAMMKLYQVPSRGFETILCHSPSFLKEDERHDSLCRYNHDRNDHIFQIPKKAFASKDIETHFQPVSTFAESCGLKNTFTDDGGYMVSANNIRNFLAGGKNGLNNATVDNALERKSDEMEYKNSSITTHTTSACTSTNLDFNVLVARRLPHFKYSSH